MTTTYTTAAAANGTETAVAADIEANAKPLSKRSAQRVALSDDQQALAIRFVPMAKALARPMKRSWPNEREEFDSAAMLALVQAAMLALVQAAQSFDPSRNVKFSTFARYRIWGALRDVQRSLIVDGWRGDLENAPIIGSLPPDAEEHGTVFGSEPDRPIGEEFEAAEFVETTFRKLPPKHAEACRQVYIEGKTQGEAAEALGCSKSRLSYLHKESLEMINDSWAYQARLEKRAKNLAKG